MTHDVCGPGTIGVFKRLGLMPRFGIRKIVLIPDHTSSLPTNAPTATLISCVSSKRIKYFYDINRANFKANPDKGVCHIAPAQEVTTAPGNFVGYRFSHLQCWCFGQFATGIGNTDAGFIMGTGKLLIKVPAALCLDGEMPSTCWRRISFCKLLGILLLGRRIEQWNLLGKPFRN